uniref:G_PROTEIN_RECEP_F1_2 domain-containing protein n=1 Tax=Caenorhabditis tropicalis TaxID=1561998 RepID=A0A1I7THB8_9PELO
MGSVFCMYPTFTYVAGGIALAMWCMACATTVSLFANRILIIAFHEYADVIEKKLAYSSILFSLSYGTYMLVFTPTICYNSVWISWIPDPLSESKPSNESAEMVIFEKIKRITVPITV